MTTYQVSMPRDVLGAPNIMIHLIIEDAARAEQFESVGPDEELLAAVELLFKCRDDVGLPADE